jgi:acetyl esterase/lipase
MYGNLHRFGPTLVVAGGDDPLLDDNRTFAQKLREAGNADVELRGYEGMPHAFYYLLGLISTPVEDFRHSTTLA